MSNVLDEICAAKAETVRQARQSLSLPELEALARQADAPRGFAAALDRAAGGGFALIAEIKKASPSHGLIRADFDPAAHARAYAAGGAACLSVLTDTPYFQGEEGHLKAARAAVALPVLRKDFMIDPYQVIEARAWGADCILLIIAALGDAQAQELEALALGLGMDVLIEVHDAAELARALKLTSPLIGVNNRNLKTLAVDTQTSIDLAALMPPDRQVVAESGLKSHAELVHLAGHGVRRFLVGESLMRQPDPGAAARALLTGEAAA